MSNACSDSLQNSDQLSRLKSEGEPLILYKLCWFIRETNFLFANKKTEISFLFCSVIAMGHLYPNTWHQQLPTAHVVDGLKQLLSRNGFAFERTCYPDSSSCCWVAFSWDVPRKMFVFIKVHFHLEVQYVSCILRDALGTGNDEMVLKVFTDVVF